MPMHLTRVRVEQLRQFRRPFELHDLAPGLNLLCGPNEAGKSTLVRAIRAAFFERHRSTAVDDLRPWGDGAASPSVELDFTLDGQPHLLAKSFLGRKRCTLRIGTRTLEGVEAEDHLAQVFGFAFAGKGASRPEHWGIPGLLWVEQGSGQTLDVSHARAHLHDALGVQPEPEAAGALAASRGDDLIERLQSWRAELLTTTGKPRAALADAASQVQSLEEQLQALDQRIATYRGQVDLLATLRAQHQADEAGRPWDALRTELQAARNRQQALQASEQQLAADTTRLTQLAQTRQLLLAQLQALAEPQRSVAARRQALDSAAAQREAAEAALAAARPAVDAAQARTAEATAALRRARLEATRAQLQQQLDQAGSQAERVAQALAQAMQAHADLGTLRQRAATVALGAQDVDQLRHLQREVRETELLRQAMSTRVQYALHAGQTVTLRDGAGGSHPLHGRGEWLLDAAATLHLPGLGELTITPGGQDLAALARRQLDARDRLADRLQRLGLADLADAEARLTAHTELQGRIRLAEQALALVAPQGLEPLRLAAVEATACRDAARDALHRLPAPDDRAAPTLPLGEAETAHEAALAAVQAATDALGGAERQHAAAVGRWEDAHTELQRVQAAADDPHRRQQQADAQRSLLDTQTEQAALAARIERLHNELRQARPDIVSQDIERLERSIQQMLHQHGQRRDQIMEIETMLRMDGAQGLEEQRDSLAGALARARRRADELQRRAAALDLLCRKLEGKRQAALARLQAPLQQRLQHYLPLLLPGAQLSLGEDLAPGALSRPDAHGGREAGEVHDLSFGSREQLGLISRFAYADLLRDAGRPTLLILDDALVHSDDERLARMKRVVFDAARRHQVLLFTCHPALWRDMGVAPRIIDAGPGRAFTAGS